MAAMFEEREGCDFGLADLVKFNPLDNFQNPKNRVLAGAQICNTSNRLPETAVPATWFVYYCPESKQIRLHVDMEVGQVTEINCAARNSRTTETYIDNKYIELNAIEFDPVLLDLIKACQVTRNSVDVGRRYSGQGEIWVISPNDLGHGFTWARDLKKRVISAETCQYVDGVEDKGYFEQYMTQWCPFAASSDPIITLGQKGEEVGEGQMPPFQMSIYGDEDRDIVRLNLDIYVDKMEMTQPGRLTFQTGDPVPAVASVTVTFPSETTLPPALYRLLECPDWDIKCPLCNQMSRQQLPPMPGQLNVTRDTMARQIICEECHGRLTTLDIPYLLLKTRRGQVQPYKADYKQPVPENNICLDDPAEVWDSTQPENPPDPWYVSNHTYVPSWTGSPACFIRRLQVQPAVRVVNSIQLPMADFDDLDDDFFGDLDEGLDSTNPIVIN